ncbi:patatin [Bacillus sp. AFS077874]|uniref:CBASS cGAMP-activated phospholipase n=1 Tax=Bacillus sp. AFS077874 TaxID=2033513 RepID=UPI000BF7EFD4|nr:CBASS cGAMP-activated phospholipase [Bacillus sp. AFS077874]PFM75234.1 patatin [Bacillus sp. AFS077874]
MIEQKIFKILSIDGGGIKGLYSAVILADFEEEYGSLSNHFDLICGTSTGGIIALAIAAGIPAKEIVKFYEIYGPEIFKYKNNIYRKVQQLKQIFITSKYSDKELKNALKTVFKDKRICDCKSNVLIPTSNITTGLPCIIKSDHSEGLGRDKQHLLVDVALATAAAPTYFPVQTIPTMENPNDQFADGGLFGNNPSLHGIQEAYRYFIGKENRNYQKFSLLSVSTLHKNFAFERRLKVQRRSFVLWNSKLISLMMDLQSISTHYHIEYLNKSLNGNYVRIWSEDLDKKENRLIDLDKAGKKSIELLIKKGHEASAKWISNEQLKQILKKEENENLLRSEKVGSM